MPRVTRTQRSPTCLATVTVRCIGLKERFFGVAAGTTTKRVERSRRFSVRAFHSARSPHRRSQSPRACLARRQAACRPRPSGVPDRRGSGSGAGSLWVWRFSLFHSLEYCHMRLTRFLFFDRRRLASDGQSAMLRFGVNSWSK